MGVRAMRSYGINRDNTVLYIFIVLSIMYFFLKETREVDMKKFNSGKPRMIGVGSTKDALKKRNTKSKNFELATKTSLYQCSFTGFMQVKTRDKVENIMESCVQLPDCYGFDYDIKTRTAYFCDDPDLQKFNFNESMDH